TPEESVVGQAVDFVVTVTDKEQDAIPTGVVTFTEGTATLVTRTLDAAGVATYTTSSLSVGTHGITAAYGGDASFLSSTSSKVDHVVTRAATSTALTGAPNPSVLGQPVTFTATVTVTAPGAGLPTGSVTFKDGTTTLGTELLDATGVATYTNSSLDVFGGGSDDAHPITAEYGGDGSFVGSTSETLNQVVNKATTTTALASSLNPSTYGNSVTFTATVSVQAPGATSMTGEDVTFRDGAATLGTGTLNASGIATVTTSLLSGGVHSVTAEYGGRPNITGSVSSGLAQTVNKASQSITFGTPGDKVYGAATFPVTATATSGLTVTFASMTPAVCTVSGNSVSLVANGSCMVRASQAGNSNYYSAANVERTFSVTCADSVVVNSTADSGYRTLRGAVANVCAGGTVSFDAALDNQTIALTSGQIAITKTVTIDGPGAEKLAVSGGGASRIFAGSEGIPITIDGLTLRNGYTSAYDGGGAIYAAGPLTITGSSFISNMVASAGDSDRGGGAVSFAGNNHYTLVIRGTSFLSNTAFYAGGALYMGNGTLDLDETTLSGNTAAGFGELGGALYCDDCDFTIDGTTFTGNQATHGGGIYLTATSWRMDNTITSSTLQENRADADSGLGGALYLGDNYRVVISDTAVLSNWAYSGGGAFAVAGTQFTFERGRLEGNTVTAQGGGIFNAGTLSVKKSTATANDAAGGGALYDVGSLSVSASSFFSNTAKNGGAITVDQENTNAAIMQSVFGGNSADCDGGAINAASLVTVDGSELYGNQAGLDCTQQALGGAIFVEDALALATSALHDNTSYAGGAIGVLGNTKSPSSVQIRGSALYSNSATMAGAIGIGGPSTTRIEQSAIYSNTATMVGGIGSAYGGATIEIVNSTLAGNRAVSTVSALLVSDSNVVEATAGYGPDTLRLSNVTIAGNGSTSPQSPGTFFAVAGLNMGYGGPTVAITNTIVAAGGDGEQACLFGMPDTPVAPPALASLDNDGTCGSNFTQSDTILLGPLGVYGQPVGDAGVDAGASFTLTVPVFPLLPGSAAI
ncbi:MAG: Ig-like domain repeat protein, partial [Caldilineaceae bacterium]|nr:Ig-like domain repeat protein [Caldilineaceae bacterium]